jgi:DHA1 family bicyclomycin/chloramphenicol resistance-like MFS transporter
VVFGANGVGIVLAGQLNGRLVGRIRERALLRSGLLLGVTGGALVLASALFRAPLALLLVSLFLLVSSIGLVMPNASSLALASHARSAGAASALLGVLQFVVGAVATPLAGLGEPGTAVPMAATMAGFALLAMVAFLALTRNVTSSADVPAR